jgi:hypothetical protein
MTDWKHLTHAYGEASEIPGLIEKLRTGPSDKLWHELWGCLCHQGTVYPASYAALPLLRDVAEHLAPSDRAQVLSLIGAIIASDVISGLDERPGELIQSLIPDLQRLVNESMRAPDLRADTFVYLLQAASAFEGDLFWGRHLDHLDGEFFGCCPACRHHVHIVIGIHGFFVTAEEWVRSPGPESLRNPIHPAHQNKLIARAAWLHATATEHAQSQVALWIRHCFGTTICPACDHSIKVADTIALIFSDPGLWM